MKYFFYKILLFLLLAYVVNFPIAIILKNNFYTKNKQSWLLNISNKQFDYATIGASRVFNMIDIKTLNHYSNKKGINLGTSGSNYAENLILLEEFLSKNSIKTIIINVDEFSLNSPISTNYPFHEYEFLPLFYKYKHIFKEYIPQWKIILWSSIPVSKYSEFNDQFETKNKFTSNWKYWEENYGSEMLSRKNEEFKFNTRINQIDKKDTYYLQEIIKLCNSKSIKTVLITAPIFGKTTNFSVSSFEKFIKTNAFTKDLPLIDYKDLINYNNILFFKDNTHTYKEGSIEYSKNLAIKLSKEKLL